MIKIMNYHNWNKKMSNYVNKKIMKYKDWNSNYKKDIKVSLTVLN